MTRGRECTGKVAHLSRSAALGVSAARRRRGALAEQVWVYRCRWCGSFHVGHRPRRRR